MKLPVLVVAAALLACSAERHPVASHGMATPLQADAATPAAKAADSVPPVSPSLSLEEFSPLLTDSALSEVADFVERGKPGLAADRLSAVMEKRAPSASELPRWQFLQARLREQAGQTAAAAEQYQKSGSVDWPLVGYAWLAAGRTLVAAGQPDAAATALQRVSSDLPIADEARLLMAEIASVKRDTPRAVSLWREHLASGEHPRDWVTVSLRLADALLQEAEAAADRTSTTAVVEQALHLSRRVALQQATVSPIRERAEGLEKRALQDLTPSERARLEPLTLQDQLVRMGAMVSAQEYSQALELSTALLNPRTHESSWDETTCEVALLRAKAMAGNRSWGKAVDAITRFIPRCQADDLLARARYLGGKYAASDGRHAQAVKLFEELEQKHPSHRLADDGRLRAAYSYYRLGAEARFTELLTRMPEDYPEGDMVLDGIFQLALRRIEKGDWPGAASVLDRGAALVSGRDYTRGTEFSGRERYFRARAWIETGERERGLDEYAALIAEVPLSYYMLNAYSRLVEADPIRAKRIRDEAVRRAEEQPFEFEHRPEFDQPGFVRAMELLSVGEVEPAKREIEVMGLADRGAAPQILWGVALLYARAGSAKLSHAIARGLLTDWLGRWPAGDWVQAWELAFPRPYRSIVTRSATRYGVPQSLVYAVMREESAFDPVAVSPADAHGLMQLIVPTARAYGRPVGLPHDPVSLKRPSVNIALGCRVLSDLRKRFAQFPELAIPGYNAGPGRPSRWLRDRPHLDFDIWVELIPFPETRRYTKRVLASQAAYAVLYEPDTADEALALPLRFEY